MKPLKSIIKKHWPFLVVLAVAFFLRLYRLDQLTTFGSDQGQDFLTVKDMVLEHKWTLLGIKTSVGAFFQGPVYLYILYPFFWLFKLQPIAGAIAAVTLSISTIILLYITCLKYFSKEVAFFSSFIFAVSPEFVRYGNTPLYQHFLPFFIVLSIFIFLSKKEDLFTPVLLGIVVGIGIELHLLNISLALAYFLFYGLFSKEKIKKVFSYGIGIAVGTGPTIIFELRHQFLNTNLFLNYQNSTVSKLSLATFFGQWIRGSAMFLAGNSMITGLIVLLVTILLLLTFKSALTNYLKIKELTVLTAGVILLFTLRFSVSEPHYILPWWILLVILFPFLVLQVFPKKIAFILLTLLITVNLGNSLKQLNNDQGYNMPPGLTLGKIDQAGSIIGIDSKTHENFNVASTLDGGTRNYPLRYTAEIYGAKPGGVENFPANNYLYLMSDSNKEKIFKNETWEISVIKPFIIGKEWNLGDNVYLYRLDRVKTPNIDIISMWTLN